MKSLAAVACAAAAFASAAHATIREEVERLPVEVTDAAGNAVKHTIVVTVFSDNDNPRPAPVLVLNHGRAAEAQVRAAAGRVKLTEAAHFLVRQGFIVAVPTRIGYGVVGGPDVENSGDCGKKNYAPGYEAAAVQTLAVLEAMRARPDADKTRAVVMGQSYGGTTAVTIAAKNAPGVVAAINFAGGGGGRPKVKPQEPCGPEKLERLFGDWGKTAKVPMLWVYTENDQYFGPRYPRQWHAAYEKAGAKAQFVQFPPQGEDGHLLFSRFPDLWQPKVAAFLQTQGFAAPARK